MVLYGAPSEEMKRTRNKINTILFAGIVTVAIHECQGQNEITIHVVGFQLQCSKFGVGWVERRVEHGIHRVAACQLFVRGKTEVKQVFTGARL